MPSDHPTTALVVSRASDGIAERLRTALDSVSVTVAESVGEAERLFDSAADCVVTRHDLPDGSGFDVHDLVSETAPTVPVVLVAEPTGTVAAEAVDRGLAGFVPLDGETADDRLVDTVTDALEAGTADDPARDDQSVLEWKADILDQLFDRIPIHLYVKDDEARHVMVGGANVDDVEAVLGTTDLESGLVSLEEARPSYEDDLEVLETGEPIVDHEEFYPSTGEWYLTSKVPRYDDGNIVGLIGVSREITDRKEAQRQLEALNERLEKFVSVVSHDLRNPLNVAQGRVELERAERDTENLEAAARAHDRMGALIEDLLTLAREGGDLEESDYERLSLSAIAEQSWADVATGEGDLTVVGDLEFCAAKGRIQQLFENLFRNSVEHGSPTISVRVGALPDGDGFYVEDDGPGIPESEFETVFESGYSTSTSGTGFGLTIVNDVVEAHSWDIRVTSADSGGARFEVSGVEPP